MIERPTRRRLLAGLSTVAVAGTAGCSGLAESFLSNVLGEVTVINETDARVGGSVTVTDPNDETVLDETFDLRPSSGTPAETDRESVGAARYNDVFTDAGSYTVAVELDEDSAIDGVREATETVSITDPDGDKLLVGLGPDDGGAIEMGVLDDGTDTESG